MVNSGVRAVHLKLYKLIRGMSGKATIFQTYHPEDAAHRQLSIHAGATLALQAVERQRYPLNHWITL